ncbi:MAG: agmatinase family protein [Acidobacteria bacterium]|nr:agmatinase family protein [Acidobacteriota bacterium]MBI3423189.1 agmatinase family protein [Acidobacteriota bacterium]
MQTPISDDPFWPRASAWLAGDKFEHTLGNLAVLGAPVRLGSVTPGRGDLAPQAVRDSLRRFSTYDIETDVDVRALAVNDHGDLPLVETKLEDAFAPLRAAVNQAAQQADAVILLGGDNGVTRPGVHGIGESLSEVGLLTLDAHFDLRDTAHGLSNGNPVRALLEDGLPGAHIVQLGILGFANSQAYAQVARDAGINVVTMDKLRAQGIEPAISAALDYLSARVSVIYFDLDVDVLDRAFAPACPGARPGGLQPWELRRAAWLCGRHPKVKAMDLVEVDPTRDVANVTVMVTAQSLLSFAAGLVRRLSKPV